MKNIIDNSLYFKDFDKHRKLFGMQEIRQSMFKKWTSKIFLNTLNGVLERFGFVVKAYKKRIRMGKIRYYKLTYSLICLYNINEIIDLTFLLKKYNININKSLLNIDLLS